MPFEKMKEWLEREKNLGSPNPNNIVLATTGKNDFPHSRIVAIREITRAGILFFTQRCTRKVQELTENKHASMTLWLPLQQREVIIDGTAEALTQDENERYWKEYPRERQLRFFVYSQTSTQPISSLRELEEKYEVLSEKFNNKTIPMSENYCGFRIIPETFYFYTIGTDTFSELKKYVLDEETWKELLLSP